MQNKKNTSGGWQVQVCVRNHGLELWLAVLTHSPGNMAWWHAVDLERTRLCPHGHEHGYRYCMFAHSLSDLRRPRERRLHYPLVWEHGLVHRWYGQHMTPEALSLFEQYWSVTPECQRPTWAIGLHLLESGAECVGGMSLSWDFELEGDLALLCCGRDTGALPFRFYDNLWARLEVRRAVQQDLAIRRPLPLIADSADAVYRAPSPEQVPIPTIAVARLGWLAEPRVAGQLAHFDL